MGQLTNSATTNKEESIRGYYRISKAWYATNKDLARPTIMIGMYYPEDGTTGEISVTWQPVGDRLSPRLSAFDDA